MTEGDADPELLGPHRIVQLIRHQRQGHHGDAVVGRLEQRVDTPVREEGADGGPLGQEVILGPSKGQQQRNRGMISLL